ncbi:uncharacterized protein HMPREF1541_00163 [Cyphellophora europaea CBS 101466]|uniref:MOCS2B n=1 Tax=Cyphellophora europaea (strain CBS 101466) TaxID=1220924 RepID=W2SB79_CYPE1|nr:uncharacterized protein HMPREF1541_00163 [Cyphellophora europaea CBS 101466]ETN45981.1 hypothetical protein HMPREF1541_00163 [Cyphellophora europaea CBS 101466]
MADADAAATTAQTNGNTTTQPQTQSQPLAPSKSTSLLDASNFPQHLSSEHVYIELRYDPLSTPAALHFTRSPSCGANVLFLGTTRNNFDSRPVSRLSYSAYPALALKSLFAIAEDVRQKHGLEKVYIAHRLGEVAIEEESIAVSVSSGHRGAGWKGAEEVLERVKQRAEIWKREWFADTGEGDWRANRDRDNAGRLVKEEKGKKAEGPTDVSRELQVDATTSSSAVQQPESDAGQQGPTSGEQGSAGKADSAGSSNRHQTSKELDSDVADYIAALTQKLKM